MLYNECSEFLYTAPTAVGLLFDIKNLQSSTNLSLEKTEWPVKPGTVRNSPTKVIQDYRASGWGGESTASLLAI